MANFSLSLEDLMSNDSSASSPFVRELNKALPTGKPLATSGSFGNTNVFAPNVGSSTLSISQMMMGVPLTISGANVVSDQEQASNQLLQSAIASTDSQNAAGLGIFNGLVPSDIKDAANQVAASNGVATTASGNQTTTNVPDPVTGTAIATNPLFNTESTAGGELLTSDLQQGNISPNIMYLINLLLTAGIAITAQSGRSGANGIEGTGYGTNSNNLHYLGEAIDISSFGPPAGSERVSAPIGPITKRAIDIISSVTGPRAPTVLLGPVTYNKCVFNASYTGSLCIGNSTWDIPQPTTPANSTVGNISSGIGAPVGSIASQGGSQQAQQAVAFAISQEGLPYVYGAESPGQSFDCSGLTQAAYASAGVTIPRIAQAQYDAGPVVTGQPLLPGDLVYFSSSNSTKDIGHVGIFIGYGNQMVDAPHTGAVVRQETFPTTVGGSWGSENYVGATRPVPPPADKGGEKAQ